jgi:GTP-binding protein HflX
MQIENRIKVVIVGVDTYKKDEINYYMEELKNLAHACEFEVVGQLTQRMQKVDNRTYIGSGKIQELIDLIEDTGAELIITNDEIKGSQHRNIERVTETKVMDRTYLILEIFSRRAKSKEAKLQVEIARLKYQKPRMIGSYEGLDRQGGSGMNKGTGETKLETDIRKIDTKIYKYEDELKKLVVSREIQRNQRKMPIVAVVGYTNVGKSTLMNAFVDEEKNVFEKDMLFATLDTSVRKIKLDSNQEFLLVDTVGFVSNLSHDLVKAFRSTLEEILEADLIIHLQDLTNNNIKLHQKVVHDTLDTIGVKDIKIIDVFNKIDLTTREVDYTQLNISAKKRINLDSLLKTIEKNLFGTHILVEMQFPYSDTSIQAKLCIDHKVEITNYEQDYISTLIYLSDAELGIYNKYIIKESKAVTAFKLKTIKNPK